MRRLALVLSLLAAILMAPRHGAAQKYGGVLKAITMENPASFSILEEASSATTYPMLGCFNNLVFYNPQMAAESGDDLVGELAESWTWSKDFTKLTFKLRHHVAWHDGKPFSSADVKQTYDLVRGVSERKLRLNPRKLWLENVADIATNGDFEVSFLLKRPQPGLASLLASGFMPVYPAHVDPAELRARVVGTGPFKLKEFMPDQRVVLEKNPDYFVKGRPYLDGVEFHVIGSRATRQAALQSNLVDAYSPIEGTTAFRDAIKSAVPQMVVQEVTQSISDNILLNAKKPPFDNVKLRQAVNYAMDREAMIKSVLSGAGVPGGALIPPPLGRWGLPKERLRNLPGFGDPAADKARARELLAEAGFGPDRPLTVAVVTRATDVSIESAVWVVGQLHAVGINATLQQVDSVAWFARLAKRDFQMAVNQTGTGAEDPDANLFENYTCGSNRNYSDYCNAAVDATIARQSQELDPAKRRSLVWEIDQRLQQDAARPMLAHRVNYFMHWPYVKNLVAKNSIFNYSHMQDVWLDR